MKRVEFEVDGDLYRIELNDQLLTMSQCGEAGWAEIARLTVAAASVLADLDAVVDNGRPARSLTVVSDRHRG
jgi:hypothetical protein